MTNIYQVETAIVVGTITLTGNASVTVTARGMTNSPKTIAVAVTFGDTAAVVGGLIRTTLAFDVDISALFVISGSGANVVLTKHAYGVNDTTLNIAITNGTCTGLTPALTSTDTTGGVLDSLYMTVSEWKANKGGFAPGDTANDDVIAQKILAAQGYMELKTGQKFKISTSIGVDDTDRFFSPGIDTHGLKLNFDKFICKINTITYGFGQSLLDGEYITFPRDPPYFAIKIKDNTFKIWQYTQIYEYSITVNGFWTWTEIPPDDIKEAVWQISNYLYDKRNQPDSDRTIVTPEGIILPAGLSKMVGDIQEVYKFRV